MERLKVFPQGHLATKWQVPWLTPGPLTTMLFCPYASKETNARLVSKKPADSKKRCHWNSWYRPPITWTFTGQITATVLWHTLSSLHKTVLPWPTRVEPCNCRLPPTEKQPPTEDRASYAAKNILYSEEVMLLIIIVNISIIYYGPDPEFNRWKNGGSEVE